MTAMAPETHEPKPSREELASHQLKLALIWEVTRGIIAMAVTLTTLAVAAVLVVQGKDTGTALALLSNTFFLVVGLYFGRTSPGKAQNPAYRNDSQ